MAGSRREARERALSLLYEAEAKGVTAASLLGEQPVAPDPFVVDVVEGVTAIRDRIDALIDRFAVGWAIDRMPVVDRNVLRLAIYELIARDDVPVGVVISEAVDLAKAYSTDDSGRFVNGVLSSIAGEVRAPG